MHARPTILASLLVTLVVPAAPALCGPLEPPAGAVSPTYKTLAQVEPRIPISAETTPGDADATPSLYKITQPGSYYLTGNIAGVGGKHGIEITAQNVTLDLNGFTLQGVPGSYSGIAQTVNADHVRVLNGFIDGWGGRGVLLVNGGVLGTSSVHRVTVRNCAMIGFQCKGTATECLAQNNGGTGFELTGEGVIRDCVAINNGGVGFYLSGQIVAERCIATGNDADGFILANHPVQVRGCTAQANGDCGIRVMAGGSVVEGSVCRANTAAVTSGSGIYIAPGVTDVRVEGNHVTQNDAGIKVDGSSSFIVRNTARANSQNFVFGGVGNTYGPVISSTGQISSTNPWANIGN